jgi:predicted outer membrane repeat protein
MKTIKFATMAIGTGALLLAFAVTPAAVASATPAAFVPCSSGATGLVAAINAANVAGGTINLAPGCTYTLTAPATTIPVPMIGGVAGLPAITNQVTINGFNTTIARSSTSPAPFRIFEVDAPSGNLTLQGLTITGGNSTNGGAIVNLGTATLNHTNVTGNTAAGGGGGIASMGTMTLNGSQVNGNTALAGGMGGGGGGILNHGGALSVNFSQVNNNVSHGGGGGIASGNGNGGTTPPPNSTLNLFFSQVNGNTSTGGPMAGAGGIANGGNANITLSLVDSNTAPGATGGGILNHGTMTITLSAVDNNTAPSDSASPPDPGMGGGIGNLDFGVPNSGVLTVNWSQVNNNTASGTGGGIDEAGFGAGPSPVAGNTLAVNFSLVAGNSAAGGGGIFAVPASPVALKFALIFRNAPDNCEPLNTIGGCHN